MKKLGLLEGVELRDYWEHESSNFTTWLFKEENLSILGETLGISIESIELEHKVGTLNVDILAKNSDTDEKIIIENQLEKTDHSHLGQILSYASGTDSKTVIWIAREFKDEHIKTLDWLNNITPDGISFFGLEMELWKIGNSEPAPKFNIVCKPNIWTKSFNTGGVIGEIKGIRLVLNEFWGEMCDYFKLHKSTLCSQKSSPRHWYDIAIGRSKFKIALSVSPEKSQIGCEIHMSSEVSDTGFLLLEEQKVEIEKELGIKLKWQHLHERGVSRIVLYENFDITNRDNWETGFKWFFKWTTKFHKVFSKRIKELDITSNEVA